MAILRSDTFSHIQVHLFYKNPILRRKIVIAHFYGKSWSRLLHMRLKYFMWSYYEYENGKHPSLRRLSVNSSATRQSNSRRTIYLQLEFAAGSSVTLIHIGRILFGKLCGFLVAILRSDSFSPCTQSYETNWSWLIFYAKSCGTLLHL